MKKDVLRYSAKIVRNFFPAVTYSSLAYLISHKRVWNYKNPKLFSEKIYWLKYYYKHNLATKIQKTYDKYTVRDYIKEKIDGGEQYLPKLYGYYRTVDEIDFDSLPNQFVIKVTQSCGFNLFCLDKSEFDYEDARVKLRLWLDESKEKKGGDDAYYYDGKSGIIIEEFLADGRVKEIDDIRFYCFNGEPRYVSYDINSNDEYGNKNEIYYRNTYDMDWVLTDINMGRESRPDINIEKPERFDEMVDVARALSADFPFVRVDQFSIEGKIIIGELTFAPMGGNGVITPKKYEEVLGKLIELPNWKFKS